MLLSQPYAVSAELTERLTKTTANFNLEFGTQIKTSARDLLNAAASLGLEQVEKRIANHRRKVIMGSLTFRGDEWTMAVMERRIVVIELTKAQRIQLHADEHSYRKFLRVATNAQLRALIGAVPFYQSIKVRESEGSRAPHTFGALIGPFPEGTKIVKGMEASRALAAKELKRRGMSNSEPPAAEDIAAAAEPQVLKYALKFEDEKKEVISLSMPAENSDRH